MQQAKQYGERTPTDWARVELAGRLRELGHELRRADLSLEELRTVTAQLDESLVGLRAAPDRVVDRFRFESASEMPTPDDGDEFANSIDRPFSGHGNAWSIPLDVVRRGEKAVTEVTLGVGFEGAPGRSHGGIVAGIYDDLLGFVQSLHGRIAFTAWLKVDYLAGTPIGEPIVFSAWLKDVDGKKLSLVGECHHGDTLISTCDALFIDASSFFTTD